MVKRTLWSFLVEFPRNRMMNNSKSTDTVSFLDRTNGNFLAYRQTNPFERKTKPDYGDTENNEANGIIFFPGFLSNMNGGKALALEHFCQKSRLGFTRFDYQGCGESKGNIDINNFPFDVWKDDALAVLDKLTTGRQVLVGSSMGGAIMLLLALERPDRIHSLIGVAAVDYGNKSFITRNNEDLKNLSGSSTFSLKSFIGQHYLEMFSKRSLAINSPVRLIHGMQDDVVKYETAIELAQKIQSEDVRIILQKSGTHRMSTPEGLELLLKTLDDVLKIKSHL